MELFALRFLFLNLNSYVCLRFRCSEFGEGTNGGGKSNSNPVLPGLIASLYFHLCVYRISISLFLCFFPRFLVASLSSSISIPVCACGFGVLSLAREWMAAENLTVIVFCQASSPPSISISVCIVFLSLFFSASFPVSSSPLSLFHRLSISICLRFSLLFFVFG